MAVALERFGQYLLLQPLARGGMGELFLARRSGALNHADLIVVKRILPELGAERQFAEMFLTEGRIASLIDHPNVVHIHELGQVGNTCFISMEYVAGKDLLTVLRKLGGPLTLPLALWVLNGICDGLAFAHDAVGADGSPLELVHRDISPQNILISYTGAVKITDFGIARAELGLRARTRAGVLKGRFGYLSPEQAQGKPVDRRSDIFALGLLLFEVTTGRPAMTGGDAELLFQATRALVPRPSVVAPGYPPALEPIVQRATAREPGDRFQTARDLQRALLGFQIQQRLMSSAGELAGLMQQLFADDYAAEQRRIHEAWLERETSRPADPPAPAEPADDEETHQVRKQDPGSLGLELGPLTAPVSDPAVALEALATTAGGLVAEASAETRPVPRVAPLAALESDPQLVTTVARPPAAAPPPASSSEKPVAAAPRGSAPPRSAYGRLFRRLVIALAVIGVVAAAYLIVSRAGLPAGEVADGAGARPLDARVAAEARPE